jgi:hypothetical protein
MMRYIRAAYLKFVRDRRSEDIEIGALDEHTEGSGQRDGHYNMNERVDDQGGFLAEASDEASLGVEPDKKEEVVDGGLVEAGGSEAEEAY